MAAGNTYEAIATQTLGSAAASVTFSSIPSTYTDLRLVVAATSSSGSNIDAYVRFNSDSGTNYSATYLYGNGTSAGSGRTSNATLIYLTQATAISSTQTNRLVDVMNYSNATTYKTMLMRENDTANATGTLVGLWRSTSAINQIVITGSANFATGSVFSLYGIKNA